MRENETNSLLLVTCEDVCKLSKWNVELEVKLSCDITEAVSRLFQKWNYFETVVRPSWILSGTTWVRRHQKGKTRKVKQTNLDLLEQEIVSGNGISWAVCKSAPWPRHITMPASHRSVFYKLDALPAAQPTAPKHLKAQKFRAIKINLSKLCNK